MALRYAWGGGTLEKAAIVLYRLTGFTAKDAQHTIQERTRSIERLHAKS